MVSKYNNPQEKVREYPDQHFCEEEDIIVDEIGVTDNWDFFRPPGQILGEGERTLSEDDIRKNANHISKLPACKGGVKPVFHLRGDPGSDATDSTEAVRDKNISNLYSQCAECVESDNECSSIISDLNNDRVERQVEGFPGEENPNMSVDCASNASTCGSSVGHVSTLTGIFESDAEYSSCTFRSEELSE